MKRRKNLAAAVLAVSMLLSNFGGTVGAVEPQIIHAAEQPAFTPLAQENSVAYERHQEGYQVSLDREKDSVTMLLSPVPQSDAQRTAEKAMLVIHTGAVLQPGVSYRVSFTLLADFAQPEYQVCFDGLTENAFGQPETRMLPNGGEDRFMTILTPEAGSGELVLRLLVGRTGAAGNRLRLKDLAVEEASQTQLEAGTDLVLVDSLNYNAPGSVTMWASEDSKATLVSGDGQATLTMIQPPADGSVWKVKMMVATGLLPETGKTYRLRANVQASKQAMYEVCYNEGDVEKGYGVLYEQQFTGNVQTLEKAIYIPRDKQNAGEIVLQLSLGKLPAGESVTISNITLEEGIPTYSNALPSDFSFEKERSYSYTGTTEVGTYLLPINFNWDGKAAATSSGDNAGVLNVLSGGVELEVNGGVNVWDARLNINTGMDLKADTVYRISFKTGSALPMTNYEILYGTGLNGVDNNGVYGSQKGLTHPGSYAAEEITYMVQPENDGPLMVSFQVGNSGGQQNVFSVSDMLVEEMDSTATPGADIATVNYPGGEAGLSGSGTSGSFRVRDNMGTLTGDGSSASITLPAPEESREKWQRGLFLDDIATFLFGVTYQVSFDITATNNTTFDVSFNKDEDWGAAEGAYGKLEDLTATATPTTVSFTVENAASGKLRPRIDLGLADEGTVVTVSNVKITSSENLASVTYPIDTPTAGSFRVRDDKGTLGGDGTTQATITLPAPEGTPEAWQRGLFIDDIATLTEGTDYEVSFDITATNETTFNVGYNKDEDWGTGENAYGVKSGLTATATPTTVTYTIENAAAGKLRPRLDLGLAAEGTEVTVTNISVRQLTDVTSVSYPTGSSFRVRDGKGQLSGNGSSATITLPAPEGTREAWQRGLFIDDIATLTEGQVYEVSFDVTASIDTTFNVGYNKDEDWGAGENAYGSQFNLNATSTPTTVTYTLTASGDGKLRPRIDLGLADEGTEFTVSNIQVLALENVAYTDYGSFEARDGKGTVNGGETSATITLPAPEGTREAWQRGLFLKDVATLTEGESYQVRFDIAATSDTEFEVKYSKNGDWGADEGAYGSQYSLTATSTPTTVTYAIENAEAGTLRPRIDLGLADEDTVVTVSNVYVIRQTTDVTSVTYPTATSFRAREDKGTLTGSSSSATITLPAPEAERAAWQRGLFIDDVATLTAGQSYRISFEVSATNETPFEVSYNKDEDWGAAEGAYGKQVELTASSDPTTVTYTIENAAAGKLRPRLDLGLADEGTAFTVSNLQVVSLSDVTSVTYPVGSSGTGSFRVRDEKGTIGGDGTKAILTLPAPEASREKWQRGLFIDDIATLTEGEGYQVSFDITASNETVFDVSYNKDEDWGDGEGAYGKLENQTATATVSTVTYTIESAAAGKLRPRLDLGLADEGTVVTISNIQVKAANLAQLTYPSEDGGDTPTPTPTGGSAFRARDEKGVIGGDGTSATITLPAPEANREMWQRGLFIDDIATLNAGSGYLVSFQISASKDTTFDIGYNRDEDWGAGENAYGQQFGLTATSTPSTVQFTVNAASGGKLRPRIDLGMADEGTVITVSNITVQEITYGVKSSTQVNNFSSIWEDVNAEYVGSLTKSADSATLAITDLSGASERTDWKAKLYLNTGVKPQAGKRYRLSFDLQAEKAQEKFHILYGYGGGETEKCYAEWWNASIQPGKPVTFTKEISVKEDGKGPVTVLLLMGLVDGTDNAFTVSNVKMEEVLLEETIFFGTDKDDSAARGDMQGGYRADVSVTKSAATMNITNTPPSGAEAWKNKFFLNTGVQTAAGASYRVVMDVTADNDMDFEICYNANRKEKGFDAIYGLHAIAGKPLTVERVFTADSNSDLIIQLSLGNVAAPNRVTVSNLQVEKIGYTYTGESAFPAPLRFTGGSAVSNWTHQDYATQITGTDNAVTVNILNAPEMGAEPWKIKLFLDTGKPLQAGTNYRVTADLLAQVDQNVELCYNNGGVEMGYDSQGGIHLTAGATQRVEKLISVPADKTDLTNLMLQVNLGATTRPNAVTVSGVRVEQVPVSYNELMDPNFAYVPGQSVNLWTNPDYTAALNAMDGAASLKVSGVPAMAQEVWKVQLRVHTGVTLTPGRSYQVRAILNATRSQGYEVCFNNEETEKGYDVLYGQYVQGGVPALVDKKITVPASMTDAGELILQFSVGGPAQNDFTVTGVSVQEMDAGEAVGNALPDTAVEFNIPDALTLTDAGLSCRFPASQYGSLRVTGANLRSADRYTVAFTAKADKPFSGAFALVEHSTQNPVIFDQFSLTQTPATFVFTTSQPLTASGAYDLVWGAAAGEDVNVDISDILVFVPAEELWVMPSLQKMTVNGETVTPAAYAVSGYNYVKLRDMALLLNGTQAQFVVRYNAQTDTVSITTGKEYTPIGGELTAGADYSATCARSVQRVTVNGQEVQLKAFAIGGNNYFRIRDLAEAVGFQVDYDALTDTVVVTSPATPERQEAGHNYSLFFRPEIDGQSQPYVGDTMPFYDDGTFYIYYLKEGGDSYNHSVYVTTTTDFVNYTELDDPVLSASRQDVQDSWIGTGSVVKAQDEYYFFYTGFNSSGSQEYHEKIMVAKGSSPTSFQKVSGWEITPPAELNQKNDFRDPMAYYDPATDTFSLTITASQGGRARVLKYTVSRDLQTAVYDGIIFTDPTGIFWNLECTDTFRLGDKWYLTYSGQEDTLWYASADSRFGPYSDAKRLDGKAFYAAKHVEDGQNSYMVGWVRRSTSPSSVTEIAGWGGNLAVQQLSQAPDGSLLLTPVENYLSAFQTPVALNADQVTITANDYQFTPAFTCQDSFLLKGKFTCSSAGSFGLAFDFNGQEDQTKLISVIPGENKLRLSFGKGATPIAETRCELVPGNVYSFTYVQDGSVGIFYLDGQAALTVRLYGTTGKDICLFAENAGVTFTALEQFTR